MKQRWQWTRGTPPKPNYLLNPGSNDRFGRAYRVLRDRLGDPYRVYRSVVKSTRYSGPVLRDIRAEKGVGRPCNI